jgi:protein TonB
MRLAALASLTGHVAAIAAFAALDWKPAEQPAPIAVAVIAAPAPGEQATAPAQSSDTPIPAPRTGPSVAAGAPAPTDLSAVSPDPLPALQASAAPAATRPSPSRAARGPSPLPPAGEGTGAPAAPDESVPAADSAPRESPAGSGLASAQPATAPVVERGPSLLPGNPLPTYPAQARRRALEGRAVVRATIAADGRVASVELLRSSSHELLDHAALESVQRWRFAPARRGEDAIAGAVDVPVVFRLEE